MSPWTNFCAQASLFPHPLTIGVVQRLEAPGGCRIFFPVLGGDGAKIAPTGDIYDQPPGEISWIRGKLADHVEDHAVSIPGRGCFGDLPGDGIVVSPPPQSLNDSLVCIYICVTIHICMVISTFSKVWINRVWLPILLVVS